MVSLRAALLVVMVAASAGAGWTARDWKCDSAEARRDAAAEKKRRELAEFELDAWQLSLMLGADAHTEIDKRDSKRQERLNAMQVWITASGPSCRRVGADGVRWLLDISRR